MTPLYKPSNQRSTTGVLTNFAVDFSRWTGSDSNPGNNAGQGRRGTDRSNVVLLSSQIYHEGQAKPSTVHGQLGRNYPEYLAKDALLGLSSMDRKTLAFINPGKKNHCN